jgi:tRNA threonylcarbamoyladenosine biosynthesis protein TsaE
MIMPNEQPPESSKNDARYSSQSSSEQPNPEAPASAIRTFAIHSLDDCRRFAEQFALALDVPIVVCLNGTLGAGKTQFTKFVAVALGALPEEVTSPTFVLVHRYPTKPTLYHLDAYRVDDEDEFLELGVEEFFEEQAVTIIEWGEKFKQLVPRDHLTIDIDVVSGAQRLFSVVSSGPCSDTILRRL